MKTNHKKDCEVRDLFKWEMMGRTRWNEHDGEREGRRTIARKDWETSGLFNAGLTPCSHTTTTRVNKHITFLVMFYSVYLLVLFCFLVVEVFFWVILVLINTLPGVSTHQNSLVVVVCEHGVSPALKSPEVSHPFLAIISFSFSLSVMFISSSSSQRSSIETPPNFAVLFEIKPIYT